MATSRMAREARNHRRRRIIRRGLRAYSAVALTAFALMAFGYTTKGFDAAIVRSDARVEVTEHDGLRTFSPRGAADHAALLFLPGALVDPDAYAPMARAVAERGYAVTVMPLPYRAALSTKGTEGVLRTAESFLLSDGSGRRWVVAGHSRGGLLTARFAHSHPELLAGVVLIGTTHPTARDDLSDTPLRVTKVYGTRDGVAPPEKVLSNRAYVPATTHWVRIEGGNHVQFGDYRYQLLDRRATIPRGLQQRIVVEALCDALKRADVRGRGR